MTGHSKDRSAVSVGVRTHSAHGDEEGGWATYVVLGGPLAEPSILALGRMQLCDPAIEGSEQPFHQAALMDLAAAEVFIERCVRSSRDLAGRVLDEIAATHGPLAACRVLTGPPRPLPSLATISAKHALQHAAERAFYRDVVRDAATNGGAATELVVEKNLQALAARLPGSEASRRETLNGLGVQIGPPWRQEERLTATAAWLGLAAA